MMVIEKGIPAHWDKALRKNGQLAVDIIKAIQDWRLEEEIVPDAREEPAEAEDLIDVEQETQKLDQEAEQEIEGNDAREEGERGEEADDSEDTVVESPSSESKRPQAKSQKSGKGADDIKSKANGLTKDFKKFSLQEMPNQMAQSDYGTLRA
jgi:hypothetical protein